MEKTPNLIRYSNRVWIKKEKKEISWPKEFLYTVQKVAYGIFKLACL